MRVKPPKNRKEAIKTERINTRTVEEVESFIAQAEIDTKSFATIGL